MKGSARLFQMPGHPWIGHEIERLVDRAERTLDLVDDPAQTALDMADVVERVAHQLRDMAADEYLKAEQVAAS